VSFSRKAGVKEYASEGARGHPVLTSGD